jgi:hypothetical protein
MLGLRSRHGASLVLVFRQRGDDCVVEAGEVFGILSAASAGLDIEEKQGLFG